MIPLAIALLHNAVLPSSAPAGAPPSSNIEVQAVACSDGIEDYMACHSAYPTGCNSNGRYDAHLNLFKNQIAWQDSRMQEWFTSLGDFEKLESALPSGLGKDNHADFETDLAKLGEGRIYGLVGYLYSVKAEGKESSNCQLDAGQNDENVDFHIYVGFDQQIAGRLRNRTVTASDRAQINPKSVIVEMTPQYRGQFHPEWTLNAVQAQVGKMVKVSGQLMVDNEHYLSSQDCGRKDHTGSCWRATVWELHPVTDFQVCDNAACDVNSSGWSPLTDTVEAGQTAGRGH